MAATRELLLALQRPLQVHRFKGRCGCHSVAHARIPTCRRTCALQLKLARGWCLHGWFVLCCAATSFARLRQVLPPQGCRLDGALPLSGISWSSRSGGAHGDAAEQRFRRLAREEAGGREARRHGRVPLEQPPEVRDRGRVARAQGRAASRRRLWAEEAVAHPKALQGGWHLLVLSAASALSTRTPHGTSQS